MMKSTPKFLLAASAIALLAACEHTGAPIAEESAAAPMIEAVAEAAQIGTATVTIGFKQNDPSKKLEFASSGSQFCHNGGCASGIALDTGDIDLSSFPPGDVGITISINDDAWNAGYRFPSDVYQAVAIAVWPPQQPKPQPVFAQNAWPAEFDAPSVAADLRSLTFVDKEDEQDSYEYAVGVNGPGGRVVLDPKITNGGVGTR